MANSKAFPKLMDTNYVGHCSFFLEVSQLENNGVKEHRKPPQMSKNGLGTKGCKKKSNGKMQYYYKSYCALVITCRFCILHSLPTNRGTFLHRKAKAKAKARSLLPNENDGRCQRGTVCRQRKVKEQMMKCVTCQENQNMSSKGVGWVKSSGDR